jgi:predicted nucleotidyltransferase
MSRVDLRQGKLILLYNTLKRGSMLNQHTIIPREEITHFCHKWNVVEFALFGSILRDDFNANSDVDVLVSFSPQSQPSLLDLAQMQLELQEAFGRSVDLVEKKALVNPYRKTAILESAEVIFAA